MTSFNTFSQLEVNRKNDSTALEGLLEFVDFSLSTIFLFTVFSYCSIKFYCIPPNPLNVKQKLIFQLVFCVNMKTKKHIFQLSIVRMPIRPAFSICLAPILQQIDRIQLHIGVLRSLFTPIKLQNR